MSNDPNPKLELAFWKWLNSQDLTIRLAIGREPDNQTRSFSLHHGGIELSGAIDERGIDISAERDGVCWDILLSLVVVPDAVRDGFQCLACIMSERRTFVDIEGLWQNHLFGPLLGWMRRRFFQADRLCFYSSKRSKWVRLQRPGDKPDGESDLFDVREK